MRFDPASQPSREVGRVLLPLRAFLGFTFCFAGLQKLANPRFFDAADPASIQSQLAGSGRLSPIHALISPLTHVAVPLGVLIACGELAIGVATLLGLWARLAAIGGLVLSFMLFLTVSFHASPYYTGSDIVFVFAWTPLVLAGAGTFFSLDTAIAERARREAGTHRHQQLSAAGASEVSRREATLKAVATVAAAAGSLIIGGLAAGVGRLVGGTSHASTAPTLPSHPQPTKAGHSSPAGHHPPGTAIGRASQVPVGQAASFQDPTTGDPSIVIRPTAATFLAFDAVCPHAGCTVGYDSAAKLLVCPCHGSEFNASTGAVERGPAASGLTKLRIAKGSNGELYVS
jgi:thiosulfate dehydrogenase (quinone) large subunit